MKTIQKLSNRSRYFLFSCSSWVCLTLPLQAVAATGYAREPSIAGQTVLFNAEQSIWSAPLAGGKAQRLTSPPHAPHDIDPHPILSPDGTQIAFLANFDGPSEIYTMPTTGGVPRRVTYKNGRIRLIGWDRNAGILFSFPAVTGPYYFYNVASVHPENGKKTLYPLANANDAALSDDGRWIYFTRFGLAMTRDNMRAYRGGGMSQLWRFDLKGGKEAERIGSHEVNLNRPMPWHDRLIVLSDENERYNLWSLATDGSDAKQLTHFTDYSVLEASISGDHIIFRKGADLYQYDLTTNQVKPVPLDLVSDNTPSTPYWLAKPAKFLTDTDLSAKGDAVVFTMRGHAVVAAPSPRRQVIIATPDTVRLRHARLSPDGKSVIAFSDVKGESSIWRFSADGSGAGEQLNEAVAAEPVDLSVSPDGKKVAHTDLAGRLWLLDIPTKKDRIIDTATTDGTSSFDSLSWSADGKTLAFVRTRGSNLRRQIAFFDTSSSRLEWVTDGRYESFTPVFSPDGKWLWFLSDRNFSLGNNSPWGDRNLGPAFPHRTGIYALALQKKTHFPFQPATELDDPEDHKDDDKKKDDKSKSEPKKPLPAVEWDGLATRLYKVPVAAADYRGLGATEEFLYTLETSEETGPLKSIHIDNNEHKTEIFAPKASDFQVTADGKKILVITSDPKKDAPDLFIAPTTAKKPDDLTGKTIDISETRLRIDPVQEWNEEFLDAWRIHRDHYYDHALQGVDWPGIRKHFEPLLARAGDRSDLDDVLAQMVAEIGAMHSQIIPAKSTEKPATSLVASLGAHLVREKNGFRIDHIYQGDKDLPDQQSPLAAPGVDAQNGDIISAVNGQSTVNAPDLSVLLADQANKQVLLTLSRNGKEHKVIVKAVSASDERDLRTRDWEINRAEAVEKASKGAIGYLHLGGMTGEDMESFTREFYANIDKKGLVIDVRGNNGGNIDSWVLTQLMRRPWMFWARYGNAPSVNFQQAFQGPIAVVTDERTYSDGEAFAQGIEALHIAPVIGERTAGAGVWLSDGTRLMDMGSARTAENPYFDMQGRWLVENKGVKPDIEVENMPVATFNGQDQQLDAALDYLQKQMATHPLPALKPEPFEHPVPTGQ
nr:PDZ domain-containing protein [Acetobacter persici]